MLYWRNSKVKRVKFIFAWYDMWIGVFVDTKKKRVYILPIPTLGIVIQYGNENTEESSNLQKRA